MIEFVPTSWSEVQAYDIVTVNVETNPANKPRLRRMQITGAPVVHKDAHAVAHGIASLNGWHVTKTGQRSKAYQTRWEAHLFARLGLVVSVQRTHGDGPVRSTPAPEPTPAATVRNVPLPAPQSIGITDADGNELMIGDVVRVDGDPTLYGTVYRGAGDDMWAVPLGSEREQRIDATRMRRVERQADGGFPPPATPAELFPIDAHGYTYSHVLGRKVKLTPSMQRMVKALNRHGDVDTIRDGGKVETVCALIDRGILRAATPTRFERGSRHHFPATPPAQVWEEAHAEHLEQCDRIAREQDEREVAEVEAEGGWGQPDGMSGMTEVERQHNASAIDGMARQMAAHVIEMRQAKRQCQAGHDAPATDGGTCAMCEQPEAAEMLPKYPAGTPEYDAYAAEMRQELGKWAAGEAPYEYPETDGQRAERHALDRPLIDAFNQPTQTANTPAEARTGINDRTAAALTDLAELRRETFRLWSAGTVGRRDGLARLDRIEAALRGAQQPQRAVDTLTGAPLWLHTTCGAVTSKSVGPALTRCDACGMNTDQWRALYTVNVPTAGR